MSISAHGRSRLNCVWRWSSGFCSALSPAIHIFAGEKVCIHAITPTHASAAFASSATRRIESGLVATSVHTTRTGISACASRPAATSRACCLDLPQRLLAVHLLAPGDEPDLEVSEHAQAPSLETSSSCAAVARDHQLGQLLERGLVHRLVDRDAAALHDVDAVAELEEMGVVVVDHDDRHPAARGEILDEVDDEARLARAHGRERLVEQQDLRRRTHRSRDRDRLPLAAGELLGLGVDARHAHLDLVEVLAGELPHRPLVEEAKRAHPRQLVAQEQVQVDRELRDQREVLVDGLDPVCAGVLDRVEVDALAADDHVAPVLLVEAAQDLDERALAGSVVADEPEHLALAQDEVDAAEDDERAEALRHAAHLERELGATSAASALRWRSCRPSSGR